jgi:predicted O-methyltransferase YrrM
MTLTIPGAIQYRESGFRDVPGWMRTVDMQLFDHVLAAQLDQSVYGDILEIGCYHGKSAIMLGYGLREDESLTVCDLFDSDPSGAPAEGIDAYRGLTADDFRRQYMERHTKGPVIHVCPSGVLRQLLESRRFRFIHIDGGHSYHVVATDIEIALDVSRPDCVVVLDDYRSPHTPGVSAAFWEAVTRRNVYPFLLSEGKAYCATTRSSQRFWLETAQGFGLPGEVHQVHALGIFRVWCAPDDPCPDEACARCRADDSVRA